MQNTITKSKMIVQVLTISGASGSGKTTLAEYIHQSNPGSLLLSLDRYYLSKKEQVDKNGFCNFDDPSAIDTFLLKEHLSELRTTGRTNVPVYDFTISERTGHEEVATSGLIIIEGLFAGSILPIESNLKIFVESDLDLALLRRIKRDMNERGRTLESVTEQYIKSVRPAYFKHVENIKSNAHHILINNGSTDQLIEDGKFIIEELKLNK